MGSLGGGSRGGWSEFHVLEQKLRSYFRLRHATAADRQRALACIKILRAHHNYLALKKRVGEAS